MKFGSAALLRACFVLTSFFSNLGIAPEPSAEPHVAVLPMDMMILPGTSSFLAKNLQDAESRGAKLVVVELNTPGGLLDTSQRMIQDIFKSPVPVVIYVSPTGSSATSAGVFITMAGHVAAMAPGTTIGAAHPVSGEGKNLESDMRAKAENITMAMVRSIAEQRGRNVEWAEKAVKESSSLTEAEALKKGVIDLVAKDLDDLLKQLKGRRVKVGDQDVVLEDLSELPRRVGEISFSDKSVNVLANPNVVALLWLGATTGISIELYNPGAIVPGVVGVICLIVALAVSQIIPVNEGAILLLIVGALLIAAELYVTSGVLGVGGIIAMVLGAVYLLDTSQAPGLAVSLEVVLPAALFLGGLMLLAVFAAGRALRRKVTTGIEGLVGQHGEARETISSAGKVFVNGELWNACVAAGVIEKGAPVEVVAMREGMVLEVKRRE